MVAKTSEHIFLVDDATSSCVSEYELDQNAVSSSEGSKLVADKTDKTFATTVLYTGDEQNSSYAKRYKKALAGIADRPELFTTVQTLVNECGLKHFFMAIEDPTGQPVIVSNWPSTVVDLLSRQILLLPALINPGEKPGTIVEFDLAQSAILALEGMDAGLLLNGTGIGRSIAYFQNSEETGNPSFMAMFNGPEKARNEFASVLADIGPMLSRTLEFVKNRELPTRHKLSKRELECIQWTSEGKTSYEISVILNLSENTVNNYIASVTKKLGAVNRTHMISLALRSSIIR